MLKQKRWEKLIRKTLNQLVLNSTMLKQFRSKGKENPPEGIFFHSYLIAITGRRKYSNEKRIKIITHFFVHHRPSLFTIAGFARALYLRRRPLLKNFFYHSVDKSLGVPRPLKGLELRFGDARAGAPPVRPRAQAAFEDSMTR